MDNQVSCRVLGALITACERKNIDFDWIVADIPFDKAYIAKRTNFIDWASFVSMLDRVAIKLTEADIFALAEESYQYPTYKIWRIIGQLRFDLFGFYQYLMAEEGVLSKLYPVKIKNLQIEPALNHFCVKYTIPDGLLPCETFFKIIEGQAIGIARFMGSAPAVVESTYSERSVVLDVKLSNKKSTIARFREWILMPFRLSQSIQLLKEAQDDLLGLQDELLQERRDLEAEKNKNQIAKEQLTLVAENQNVLLWTKNLKLEPTYYSESIQSYLGYTVEEAMNLPSLATLSEKSREDAHQMFEKRLRDEQDGKPFYGSETIRFLEIRKDGSTFWSQSFISFMRNELNEIIGVAGVSIDMTEVIEREALHESMSRQLDVLRQRELVGQVAGGIAHDFNNSLQAITGFSELLLDREEVKHLPGDVIALIEHILRSAGSAAELVKKLLALSKKQTLTKETLSLKDWFTEFQSMAKSILGESIELTIDIDATAYLLVDPIQLERALLNLVLNAKEAMGSEGQLVIRGRVSETDSQVVISVEDSGPGIPPSDLEKVFEPFFSSKTGEHGTGLGLAVTAGIVSQHAGYVRAENSLKGGAIIKLFMPLANETAYSQSDDDPLFVLRGIDVLVVDDEEMVRDLCRTFLESEGARVVEASSGQEGVAFAETRDFDLILMDVVMPGLKGNDAAQLIRTHKSNQKILFMTGYAGSKEVVEDLAVEAVLPKPFRRAELFRAIGLVLDHGVSENSAS